MGTGDGDSVEAPSDTGTGSGEEDLASRVREALGDDEPAAPEVESGSARDSSSTLSPDESGRYDAIRQRYLRLMRNSGSAPPEVAPTPAPTLPSMTGSAGGGSSDFDFQPLPGDAESQPLPGMGSGSQPLPGMDDQPLPGLDSSSIEGAQEDGMELPDVGMPGLGYIEGTD
jgi:hypothetical protein